MQLKINILKSINMIKRGLIVVIALLTLNGFSQERVKVDGVAVVVGKNIVLDSDIEKFKKEIEMRSEGKITISNCEMLEEIMVQKLMAHHAIIDSIVVSDDQVMGRVEETIASFAQQLGGDMNKVVEYYGFNDEEDLRKELSQINRDQFLIQGERESITAEIDVTPDEVRTYFNSLKKDDNLPEIGAEIELSQIVMKAKPTDEEIQRIKDKLNQIRLDVENGSSMNMKAILNSDDPGVAENGGFYSINRQSQFVKEFKEVAFSLEEGQVSEPFESDFGYHILKVEKIRGQQLDVRHILMQPEIDSDKLKEVKTALEKVAQEIKDSTMTYEEAVLKYSEDKKTKYNKGILINPGTGDSYFDLTRMDPTLYSRVANLTSGEFTDAYFDETREGEKMFKLLLLKSKSETHTANYVDDYVKIQALALQKKQEEAIEDWADDKIEDTYIKINADHKDCTFDRNWIKDKK
jgi:peptidyl-prolyl cis-trans isomerase SurA